LKHHWPNKFLCHTIIKKSIDNGNRPKVQVAMKSLILDSLKTLDFTLKFASTSSFHLLGSNSTKINFLGLNSNLEQGRTNCKNAMKK